MKFWFMVFGILLTAQAAGGLSLEEETKWFPGEWDMILALDPGVAGHPEVKSLLGGFSSDPKRPFPDFSTLEQQLGLSLKDCDQVTLVGQASGGYASVVVLRLKKSVGAWLPGLMQKLRWTSISFEGRQLWQVPGDSLLFMDGRTCILFRGITREEFFSKKKPGPVPLTLQKNHAVFFQFNVSKEILKSMPKTLQSCRSVSFSLVLGKDLSLQLGMDLGNADLAGALKELLDGAGTFLSGAFKLYKIASVQGDIPRGFPDPKTAELMEIISKAQIKFSSKVQGGALTLQGDIPWKVLKDLEGAAAQIYGTLPDLQKSLDDLVLVPSETVRLELEKAGGWKALGKKLRNLRALIQELQGSEDPQSLDRMNQAYQEELDLQNLLDRYRKHLYPEEQKALEEILYQP